MIEPTDRDREIARGHLTMAPWDMSSIEDVEILARSFARAREEGRQEERKWQPIKMAIEAAKANDGWIPRSLFAIKREWGWEMWVGQCDHYDIWLGRCDDASCFDTEMPTHWMRLPTPPENDAATNFAKLGDAAVELQNTSPAEPKE